MSAPVTFSLSLAPLPSTFDLTPQEFAQAIVDRLLITPSEPWSSFRNGGSTPTSDIGPFLKNSQEWMVWNSATGAYISQVQDGSGIRAATVPLSAMAQVAGVGSVLISNPSKAVAELPLSSGTTGQFLKNDGTAPVWADLNLPTKNYFEVALTGANQALNTAGGYVPIIFDTILNKSDGVTFDVNTGAVTVKSGEVWYFYTSLQLEDSAAPSTNLQIILRVQGTLTRAVGSVVNVPATSSRLAPSACGVMAIGVDDLVKVYIEVTEDTPDAGGMEIAANGENTRFGGFRIA